jgi:predicted nuclease with TOPRIM domain
MLTSRNKQGEYLMPELVPENLIQAFGAVAMAAVVVMLGIQKIIKHWQTTDAENSIIKIMHNELERMSQQNTALSVELGRLHNEVIALNQQLQMLTVENQRLQTEVVALTNEVSSFKLLRQGGQYGKI